MIPEIYDKEIYIVSMHDVIAVISSSCNQDVNFVFEGNGGVKEYKVQPGNTYYEIYDGSLYTKGLSKMLKLREYDEEENQIILPEQIKEFSADCLKNIIYMMHWDENPKNIIIDEKNSNFLIENNWIYNKDKTKLIMPIAPIESMLITDEPLEISKELAEYFYEIDTTEYDSCYIYKGSLYTEGLKVMLDYFLNDEEKNVEIPSEVEDFSENCIYKIMKWLYDDEIEKIIIDEKFSNLVIEDKFIYNKNKTKLLMPIMKLDYWDYELPYLDNLLETNEYLEISKAMAEEFVRYSSFIWDEGPFVIYKGALYTKGLEKILSVLDSDATEIELPHQLRTFGEVAISEIIYNVLELSSYGDESFTVIVEENNPNFIVEDDLLYNTDKTVLIMPLKKMDKIIVKENVERIENEFLRKINDYSIEVEILGNNENFEVDKDGTIRNVNKYLNY